MYDICKRLLSGDVVGSRMGMGVVVGPSPSMESVSASEPERRHRRAMFVIYGMLHVYCIVICDVTIKCRFHYVYCLVFIYAIDTLANLGLTR